MSDTPRDDDPRQGGGSGQDPFAEFLARLGQGGQAGANPFGEGGQQIDFSALMAQVQQMLGGMGAAGSGGLGFGVNPAAAAGQTPSSSIDWTQARNATRQLSATKGADPSPSEGQQRALADAARLAELWLDEACEFPAVPAAPQVWSRAEWIENTLDSWKPIVEPIAASLGDAMSAMLTSDDDEPEVAGVPDPLAGLTGMLTPLLRQMAAGMYTMQFSQALAELSTQVVSGAEIGMQLLPTPRVALLQSNIDTLFGELEQSADDVRLYLTLREAARQRLFSAVSWLGPQLLAMVEHYARETTIDRDAIEQAIEVDDLQSLTPEKLQQLSDDLQGKLFAPTTTDEQKGVLQRLETLLALTEGWVDHVVAAAASKWMPTHESLAEIVRRRRGVGGPVEKVFQALVGLELRPRRVRDAQNLWAALEAERGLVERDAVWSHPDLLPTSADLDDPLGFAKGERQTSSTDDPTAGIDLDAELAKLLEQERGDKHGDTD